MLYLYIHEDGEVHKRLNNPAQEDLESVYAGVLQVLKIEGQRVYDLLFDGSWKELEDVD